MPLTDAVFVDSDVILDVALSRQPFFEDSFSILCMVEDGFQIAYTSSNCLANIHYILRKNFDDKQARHFIKTIIKFIKVIGIEYADVLLALDSDFKDFEDSLQYHSALRHHCQAIITRNTKDYQHAKINIYSPTEFIAL